MVYVKKSYDKKIDGKEIYKGEELEFGVNAFDSIEDAIEAGESEIAVLDSKTEIKTDITDDVRITTNYNNEKYEDNYEGETWVSKSTLTVKGGVDASGVYADAFANVTVGKDAMLAGAWGGTSKWNESWNDDNTVTSSNGNWNVGGTFTAEKGAEIGDIEGFSKVTLTDAVVTGLIEGGKGSETFSEKTTEYSYAKSWKNTYANAGKLIATGSKIDDDIENYADIKLTDTEVSGEIDGGTASYSLSTNSSTSASGDVTKMSEKSDNKLAVSGSVTISVTKDQLEDATDDVDFAAVAGIFGYSKVVISGTEGKEYDAYAVVGDIKAMETEDGSGFFAGSFRSTKSGSLVEKEDSLTVNTKESIKAAAAGSVKLAVAKAGDIVGYKNVILTEDSYAESIDAGLNVSVTRTYDYSEKNDKVASTDKTVVKGSSVGTVTVDGAFVNNDIVGYAKVIIEDGAFVGKISNGSDFVEENVTTDEGTDKEKIVYTRTDKVAGSVTVKANKNYDDDDTMVAGDIVGYAKVNVSGYNAKGDILFVTVGNIFSSNTKTVSTTKDGATETKTTIDTVGKVTVTNAWAQNIDAKTVVLEKAHVGNIGTTLIDDVTQNLKGNSLTMKGATVTGIQNVETVTVAKGVNALIDGAYSNNSEVADKFTIAAGASLILTEDAAISADKKDKVTVNGSLIVNSADNIADIACDILGKGEIAASDDVLADIEALDLDIAKSIKLVNTGATSEGFVGSKFEAADNTAKAAVNWDFDFDNATFTGWLNGGADADVVDKVDYIKFYVDVDEDNDEVKFLEIGGDLADDDKVIVNGKTYTFEDFSAEDFEIKKDGLYTVGIELGKTNSDKTADSFSYTIAVTGILA